MQLQVRSILHSRRHTDATVNTEPLLSDGTSYQYSRLLPRKVCTDAKGRQEGLCYLAYADLFVSPLDISAATKKLKGTRTRRSAPCFSSSSSALPMRVPDVLRYVCHQVFTACLVVSIRRSCRARNNKYGDRTSLKGGRANSRPCSRSRSRAKSGIPTTTLQTSLSKTYGYRRSLTDLRSNECTTTQMEHQEHIPMQTIRPHTYTKVHTDNHTPD